jgi:hypothetical protein
MRGRRGMAGKPSQKLMALAAAMQAPSPTPAPVPPTPVPPQSLPGPSQPAPTPDMPVTPPTGATDGLGAGSGGLAVHPSLKGAKIANYEPRHSSKHR